MSDLRLFRPDKRNFKFIFAILVFMAIAPYCHAAADLENCKTDCKYYQTSCVKNANKASQQELQLYILDTNPNNSLEADRERNQAKEERRLERLNKCDNSYSSCVIDCANPAFK
ncbi:MAG: hypothetical protein ACOH1I_07240 [Gallionellaceae bacterium]